MGSARRIRTPSRDFRIAGDRGFVGLKCALCSPPRHGGAEPQGLGADSRTGPGTLGSLACGSGDTPVWDGLDWTCAPNETPHTTSADDITLGTLDVERLPVGTSSTDVAAGDHLHALADLTGRLTSAQLPGDFDAEVVAALGAIDAGNPLNHDRYTDGEAVSAMGAAGDGNALNHTRYSDSEAVAAMGAIDASNPLNHDAYTDADAVGAVEAGLVHQVSGRYIKLYGDEVTLSGNNPRQTNPRLNMTATRANFIGSVSFELIGANHCNYCYSGGPKAVWWNNGTVPFNFYALGDSVYVDLGTTNTIVIRSSYPIAPSAVSALPSGVLSVVRMN